MKIGKFRKLRYDYEISFIVLELFYYMTIDYKNKIVEKHL